MMPVPNMIIYPRCLDHGRWKQEQCDFTLFTPTQRTVVEKFTAHIRGKYFVPRGVFNRWTEELLIAIPEFNLQIVELIGAQTMGYRSVREMTSKRCQFSHLQIKLTKTRKHERRQRQLKRSEA